MWYTAPIRLNTSSHGEGALEEMFGQWSLAQVLGDGNAFFRAE